MRMDRRAAGLATGLLLQVVPVLALLCFCPLVSAADGASVRRVLVLYPMRDGHPGVFLVDQGLRRTFETALTDRVELYNEYLDAARFPDERYQRRLAEFLRQKYAGLKIEALIALMAPALDFALKYREEILPGVPIVFAVMDETELKTRQLGPGVVGAPMRFDLVPTLELALQLHPGTRRVVVITGAAKIDAAWDHGKRIFKSK